MQRWIKPGVKLIDMCELLEDTARNMVEANGLKSGEEYTQLAWNYPTHAYVRSICNSSILHHQQIDFD